jgi:hypothetical protein
MKKTLKFKRYDAELNTDPCNAYNNANLTLITRLRFNKINPPKGAKEGTHPEVGGILRKIIPWTDDSWKAWKYNFLLSAQNYWSGKFWLYNNCGGFAFKQRGETYLPNIYCLLKIIGSDTDPTAHHIIDVVRLKPGQPFRSHAKLYDSEDLKPTTVRKDSKGKPIYQSTHVHEVGHLLGLGHVDIGKAHCPTTNTNDGPCYGKSDESKNSIMGAGMKIRDSNSAPWITAIEKFKNDIYANKIYTPPKKRFTLTKPYWTIERKRIYPSTVAEYEAIKKIYTVQKRKI